MTPRPTRPSRRVVLAGLAAAAVPAVASGLARADAADDLLGRIAAARRGLRSLAGPFTQTRTVGLLATDVRSTGAMTLVTPDRIRWELAPPDATTFWVGPEGVAYRSASGSGRLPPSSARSAGALDDLRAALGGDPRALRTRWDVRVVRDDATGAELDARPLDGGAVAGLRLALGPDLVKPTRVTLVEGPRDRTVIEFGSLVVNGPVDPASMRPGAPPPSGG